MRHRTPVTCVTNHITPVTCFTHMLQCNIKQLHRCHVVGDAGHTCDVESHMSRYYMLPYRCRVLLHPYMHQGHHADSMTGCAEAARCCQQHVTDACMGQKLPVTA